MPETTRGQRARRSVVPRLTGSQVRQRLRGGSRAEHARGRGCETPRGWRRLQWAHACVLQGKAIQSKEVDASYWDKISQRSVSALEQPGGRAPSDLPLAQAKLAAEEAQAQFHLLDDDEQARHHRDVGPLLVRRSYERACAGGGRGSGVARQRARSGHLAVQVATGSGSRALHATCHVARRRRARGPR